MVKVWKNKYRDNCVGTYIEEKNGTITLKIKSDKYDNPVILTFDNKDIFNLVVETIVSY